MGWVTGFFSGLIISSSILNVVYQAEDLGVILAPGRTVPFVVVGTVLAVVVAALVGTEIPARKASKMSPMEALSAPL
jgi:ABC-type antimicrobial peptide transport system permease subunit